jgi:hypothetical protein
MLHIHRSQNLIRPLPRFSSNPLSFTPLGQRTPELINSSHRVQEEHNELTVPITVINGGKTR